MADDFKCVVKSGMIGVFVACLIFAAFMVVPWFELGAQELPKSELLAFHDLMYLRGCRRIIHVD